MFKVRISPDGWLVGPNCPSSENDTELEIEDVIFDKIATIPFNSNWRYINGEFVLQDLVDTETLKNRRQKECFNIVDNRSPMWYNHLTAEQKAELDDWYQAWLDVTETHIIPTKPSWL